MLWCWYPNNFQRYNEEEIIMPLVTSRRRHSIKLTKLLIIHSKFSKYYLVNSWGSIIPVSRRCLDRWRTPGTNMLWSLSFFFTISISHIFPASTIFSQNWPIPAPHLYLPAFSSSLKGLLIHYVIVHRTWHNSWLFIHRSEIISFVTELTTKAWPEWLCLHDVMGGIIREPNTYVVVLILQVS